MVSWVRVWQLANIQVYQNPDLRENNRRQAGAELGHTQVFSHVNLSLIWSKLVETKF